MHRTAAEGQPFLRWNGARVTRRGPAIGFARGSLSIDPNVRDQWAPSSTARGEIVARARATDTGRRAELAAKPSSRPYGDRADPADTTRVTDESWKSGREPRHLLALRQTVARGGPAQIQRAVGSLASIDMTVLGAAAVLVAVGLLVLQSASSVASYAATRDSAYYLVKQVRWLSLGVIVAIVVTMIDYHRFASLWHYGMAGCVVLLGILFTGLGQTVNGAQRWIALFGVQLFQPAEVIKPVLVVVTAAYLTRDIGLAARFRDGLLAFGALYGTVIGLLLMQPDMGTAVVVGVTGSVIFIVAGARRRHLLLLGVAGLATGAWLVVIAPYRVARWTTFLDPWANSQGSGYHVVQSLLALGSGGITGVGPGVSRQKFFFLPFPHTDSVFAVLGEEFGLVGTVTTIFLFLLFMWRGLGVAMRAPDLLGRCIAAGATMGIVGQAMINIAVLTSSVPFTGITLPFFSYGGSSIIACCAMCGLILSVSRHVPREANQGVWWANWRALRHAAAS
jgi:cell division protein FtsW